MTEPVLRDVVVVEGPDAVTYLQGQLSQDVAAVPVGGSALTFLLEPQGRIVAIGRLARRSDDRVEIDVEAGLGAAVLARLQRFKLRTRAEVSLEAEVPYVAHRGSEPAPDGALVPAVPGATGWDEARGDAALGASAESLEAERIRLAVPAARDLDERAIPAETGIVAAAASFTKGCYTGQELVARMDSRVAEPPRRLRRITGSGAPPPVDAVVAAADGRAAGVLTSVAAEGDGWIGLALVPRAVAQGGVDVTWDGGRAAASVEA